MRRAVAEASGRQRRRRAPACRRPRRENRAARRAPGERVEHGHAVAPPATRVSPGAGETGRPGATAGAPASRCRRAPCRRHERVAHQGAGERAARERLAPQRQRRVEHACGRSWMFSMCTASAPAGRGEPPVVGVIHRHEGGDVEPLARTCGAATRPAVRRLPAGAQHVGVPLVPRRVGDLGDHRVQTVDRPRRSSSRSSPDSARSPSSAGASAGGSVRRGGGRSASATRSRTARSSGTSVGRGNRRAGTRPAPAGAPTTASSRRTRPAAPRGRGTA